MHNSKKTAADSVKPRGRKMKVQQHPLVILQKAAE